MHDNRQVLYIGIFGAIAFIVTCVMCVCSGIIIGFTSGLAGVISTALADFFICWGEFMIYNGTHEL